MRDVRCDTRLHWPSAANRDRQRIYTNRFTLSQAVEHAPGVDWPALFEGLGTRWYNHVVLWWGLFVLLILGLVLLFSGLWL